mmetsp:Transcript_39233/g.68450  ORF Transcript_39233/g.68450 Transcript_39233/m.68450 type:complete len:209 (-) Transcript_39233:48-674(-)
MFSGTLKRSGHDFHELPLKKRKVEDGSTKNNDHRRPNDEEQKIESKKEKLVYLRNRVVELGDERRRLVHLVETWNTAISVLTQKHGIKRAQPLPAAVEESSEKEDSPRPGTSSSPSYRSISWQSKTIVNHAGESRTLSEDEMAMIRESKKRQARLTRDRNKMCVERIESIIARLEKENAQIKKALLIPFKMFPQLSVNRRSESRRSAH